MKLLFCKECQDIIRLIPDKIRECKCGKVGGKYINELNAVYFGKEGVPIGFKNSTLANAIYNQPEKGLGKEFIAFVIPKICPTIKLIPKNEF